MGTHEKAEFLIGYGWCPLPWQNNEHQKLDYLREPFNNHADVNYWREIGHTVEHFTGEMYDMRRPTPSWFDLSYYQKIFQWQHLSWSFYKMAPGVILPPHVDTFARFKSLYGPTAIRRALIFLEDWQPGHHLDIGNDVMHAWRAGQYVWWSEKAPHTAANCGLTDRYTLQLTGVANEDF